MNVLAQTLTRRVSDTGGRDPDTLHGLLCLVERGASESKIAPFLKRGTADVFLLLDDARRGAYGRVPPVKGCGDHQGVVEELPGIFPRQWKRDVIALMLAADGASTFSVRAAFDFNGSEMPAGDAVRILRDELRVFGVEFMSGRIGGSKQHCWRIIGHDAWRLQKMIANGWSL